MCEVLESINYVLEDTSYQQKYGFLPTSESTEIDRIQTHLSYVENLLAHRTGDNPNIELICQLLHDYSLAAKFPENLKTPNRTPVFIDHRGVYCAVGHLMSKTEQGLAEKVSSIHNYDLVKDFQFDSEIGGEVISWANRIGLCVHDLAMIQPRYHNMKYGNRGRLPKPESSDEDETKKPKTPKEECKEEVIENGTTTTEGQKTPTQEQTTTKEQKEENKEHVETEKQIPEKTEQIQTPTREKKQEKQVSNQVLPTKWIFIILFILLSCFLQWFLN